MENSKSDGGDRRDSERKKLAKEERMRDLKVEEQVSISNFSKD